MSPLNLLHHTSVRPQRDFRFRSGSRTRLRRVAPAVVGIDKREFHGIAPILAGRVQGVAMEKYRIARSKMRRLGGTKYVGVVRAIGTKEFRVVEPIGVERRLVGTWHEPERAVVDGLVAGVAVRSGRPWILKVGFEFERVNTSGEMRPRRRVELRHLRDRHEPR